MVDQLGPVSRAVYGPFGEEGFLLRGSVEACPEAGPGPLLGVPDHFGGQGIAFDVSAEGQEVIVLLDGEAFESALIEMAITDGVMRHPPAHGVSVGEPAEEVGDLVIVRGVDDEMPVAGQDAVGENADWMALVGLEDDALEGLEIVVVAEEFHATDRAVEDVIDQAAGGAARLTGHGRSVSRIRRMSTTRCVPVVWGQSLSATPSGIGLIKITLSCASC